MLKLYADLTTKDKNGEKTQKRTIECQSFLVQFLKVLFIQTNQKYMSIKELSGSESNATPGGHTFSCDGDSGETDRGSLVGTGNTAPTINDYCMENKIGHGTGTGQLQYSAISFGSPSCDSSSCHCTITRDFSNGSGGDITVNEIGLANEIGININHSSLMIRDVISGGILVPNGQTLTLNYRIKVTA